MFLLEHKNCLGRIELVDKNVVVPFQKSQWNTLCKNGFLLKIPLFSKPNFKMNFYIQAPQQHHFCTVNSLLMLQKPLGYGINKFGRYYRVPEKSSFLGKLKITKIVSVYDQEISQSQTADNPVAPRGRAAQPSRDNGKTN